MRMLWRIGLLSCLFVAPMFALKIDTDIQGAFEKLTKAYAGKYPSAGMKKGLAVLKFEENLQPEKNGLGQVVRAAVEQKIITSQIFFLIDRDTLETSLKEISLSLSGVVDESKAVEVGKLAGVQVFIAGAISESGSDFVVTMKMIDVASGVVVAVETIQFAQTLLYEKKREFGFEYISKFGLGANLQISQAFITAPVEGCDLTFYDAFMNYRPALWLNFKLGVSYVTLNIQSKSGIPMSTLYPDFALYSNAGSYSGFTAVNYNTAGFDTLGIFGGVDCNWTPVEFFTLGVGVSVNVLNPVLIQNYTPLAIVTGSNVSTWGNLYIEQQLEPIYVLRLEVKPQYFISPRMTIGLYGALMFATQVKVYKTTINGDIYYPDDVSYGGKSEKNAGLDFNILSDGKNAEDISFNFGIAVGGSINFYF